MEKPLRIYVVYDHPKDYPDSYIVKRDAIIDGEVVRDDRFLMLCPDLEVIREAMLQMGLSQLARMPEDDTVILETWI